MSRLTLPTKILENLLPLETILTERFTVDVINEVFSSPNSQILEWMANRRLIRNTARCDQCFSSMRLSTDKGMKLGKRWICKRPCKNSRSVLTNSYFEDIKINFRKYFRMIYMWSKNNKQCDIAEELSINPNTVCEFSKDMREICAVRMIEFNELLGGIDADGNSIVVEIDESLFFKRKFHVGRVRNQQWVLGMVERGSNKCILIPIENRRKETLMELIRLYVRPGSTIITDGWAGYNELRNDPSYIHYQVIHEYNFVDPVLDFVHTQSVEGMWSHAKKKLRYQNGTTIDYFEGYLSEFMFRKRFGSNNIFNQILYSIARFY